MLYLCHKMENTAEIFDTFFNTKLFKEQLSYFKDIDYTEEVTSLSNKPPSEKEIQAFLTEKTLSEF